MPGINLLPDELRAKESKELEAAKKGAKEVKIELSKPSKEPTAKPAKRPFWSRLFSRPKAKPMIKPALPPAVPLIKKEPEKPKPAAPAPVPVSQPFRPIASKPEATPAPKPQLPAKPAEPTPAPKPQLPEPFKSQVLKEINREEAKAKEVKADHRKKSWLSVFSKNEKSPRPEKSAPMKAEKGRKTEPKKEKMSILDVNLMPAELIGRPELEASKKIIISSMMVLIAVLAVAGAYLGLTWYQIKATREMDAVRSQIKQLDADIAKSQEQGKAAIAVQDNLKTIKGLLNSHIYWTKFFGLLEKYTLTDVYYTNFSMSGKESLTIAATGRDYVTVAKQLVAFQQAKDFAKDVKIDNAAAVFTDTQISGVTFNISLDLGPDVFLKPISQ